MPGMIIAVQTFSDDLGWHPHLHALMTDGVFDEKGVFHPLEHLSLSYIKDVFEKNVLISLRMKELISEETIKLNHGSIQDSMSIPESSSGQAMVPISRQVYFLNNQEPDNLVLSGHLGNLPIPHQ